MADSNFETRILSKVDGVQSTVNTLAQQLAVHITEDRELLRRLEKLEKLDDDETKERRERRNHWFRAVGGALLGAVVTYVIARLMR